MNKDKQTGHDGYGYDVSTPIDELPRLWRKRTILPVSSGSYVSVL